MYLSSDIILELESLSPDGIYSLAKIEWWLLKYSDEYKRIRKEESKHFLHSSNGDWVKLPDYIESRTPNEKFIHIYEELNEVSEYHQHEEYFRQEMAIYKEIRNSPDKVREWLAKNEYLGTEKYFMFSMDYFGDEDEMENEIHLQVNFSEDNQRVIFVDRSDFKYTIEFTNTFNNLYWEMLEKLNLKKLN